MFCRKLLRSSLCPGFRQIPRCPLFTDESLGLVSFDLFRRQRLESCTISKDELWHRLEQSCCQTVQENQEPKRKLIFSEDILQAVAAVETRDEADRLYRSVAPFVKERFDGGQYRMLKRTTKPLAPLLMKLFHRIRHDELAFRALISAENQGLEEFFGSNLQCYQIGMDLLFEARRYQQVLDVWDVYERRRRSGGGQYSSLPCFPRSLQVLVLAACYKMNSAESLQYATKFIESGYESGPSKGGDQHQDQPIAFTRKALALASGLAVNQNEIELAFEFLSLIGHEVVDAYTAPRTLKCILLTKLGRWSEVYNLFKRVLESDVPSQAYQDRELSIDAIRAVEAAMGSIGNKEIVERLKRACLLLRRGGHVIDVSLDNLLCAPVQIIPPTLLGSSTPAISGQQLTAIGPGAAVMTSSQSSLEVRQDSKVGNEEDEEKNMWETSSVYDNDSSAIASMEKFRESERKLQKMERRKKKILNTVGKWIRQEGPFEVEGDRSGR